MQLEAQALANELRKTIEGEVRFDAGSRALYATDGSNYRQVPIGVVVPRSLDDVIATLAVCRRFGAPVLSRGCGTSLAGQCCNVAVVIDFSKHVNRLLDLDPERRLAVVEPGLILDHLRDPAERHHLTFAPDPSTHDHCTLGGMIGNNSCGVHSVMAGRTSDNVEELEVTTYDGVRLTVGKTDERELERLCARDDRVGAIYRGLRSIRDRYGDLVRARYPKIPRRVSGYNLDELLPENGFHVARALVGTEATCVTILRATLRLVHSPPERALVVLGYPSIFEAGDHVPEVMEAQPVGCEAIDDHLVEDMRKKGLHSGDLRFLPDGRGWLLVELGADTREEVDAKARLLEKTLRARRHAPAIKVYEDRDEEKLVWKIRESGLGATARIPGAKDTWEGWEDSAVHPRQLGSYLRGLRALYDRFGYDGALYGHFGQGCVHTRIDFDLVTQPGIEKFREFLDAAADLVVAHGGSISGEHGDGQSKADLLPKMFGPELIQAFREFKALWDPDGKMNPGKVVDPYHPTVNLRLGADYRPPPRETYFAFPDDQGSFARATERCVGVGTCRRTDGGTMCPSYMVTREEMHSTRGRTHLLFEMMRGDSPVDGGWRDPHVREALDLCLACKGCKGDCPVNVDVATYKAEFLAHYYGGPHIRPRSAYAMGLIYWWARVASRMPRFVNFVAHAPILSDIFKWLGGVHPKRELPRFAVATFRDWFARRPITNEGKPQVMLWPDTWSNFFLPSTAVAATEVLEAAGYQVILPPRILCCGRPLYDHGWLVRARKQLEQILETLHDDIARGTPLVVLEPSCLSVLHDELKGLLPHDLDARRLAEQSYLLPRFLVEKAHFHPPHLDGLHALVQGHCHQKALQELDPAMHLLDEAGLDPRELDAGCCGMAGAFGYEKPHRDVSLRCGERKLLPAVRAAPSSTIVVSDGFSCREQIQQETDRRALHLAEVLQLALHDEARPRRRDERPEDAYERSLGMTALSSLRQPAAAWLALVSLAILCVLLVEVWLAR